MPSLVNKMINNKNKLNKGSIDDTIKKLKTPSAKSHRKNLEKMKQISLNQEEMIEKYIIFRKSCSNNTSPRGGCSPTGVGSHEGSDSGEFCLQFDQGGDGNDQFARGRAGNPFNNMGNQGG
mmetsp:Transcript_26349/g.23263  ORF Transcript_26349/g.23263 Transcript_26349/m.23263 type:complete len:121 (+) Transcript_26349:421-783(+)